MPTIIPLAIILLVASAISGAVGQVLNASIIALMGAVEGRSQFLSDLTANGDRLLRLMRTL